MRRIPNPGDWESWIDRQIREAQERGDFDNLPGKGQPLDLTPNPYALDQEIAFKILKNAGCAPEWIEMGKVIRSKSASARAMLTLHWRHYQARSSELAGRTDRWAMAESERARVAWQQAVTEFFATVEIINKEIVEYNLQVPSPQFQRVKIDAACEIKRVEGGHS